MTQPHIPRPQQTYHQFGEAAGEAMRSNAEMAARHAEARAREDAERAPIARVGWAGTTTDRHDLHLFGPERTAQCDPTIRTYSRSTPNDQYREPYMTLRARAQIEATGFADMYTFCPACTAKES